MIGVGTQIVERPILLRFSHETGEFAPRLRPIGEPGHPFGPAVEGLGTLGMVADPRLHAVIDHHPQIGIAPEQSQEIIQMRRKTECIEGEVELDDGLIIPKVLNIDS